MFFTTHIRIRQLAEQIRRLEEENKYLSETVSRLAHALWEGGVTCELPPDAKPYILNPNDKGYPLIATRSTPGVGLTEAFAALTKHLGVKFIKHPIKSSFVSIEKDALKK